MGRQTWELQGCGYPTTLRLYYRLLTTAGLFRTETYRKQLIQPYALIRVTDDVINEAVHIASLTTIRSN